MARWAVEGQGLSIRLACEAFGLSESGYRYQPQLNAENAKIAEWLQRLTENQRDWGFGLCFLCLRNVKGFLWNHKCVYRIYRELELNLRIKPKKRMVLERNLVRLSLLTAVLQIEWCGHCTCSILLCHLARCASGRLLTQTPTS